MSYLFLVKFFCVNFYGSTCKLKVHFVTVFVHEKLVAHKSMVLIVSSQTKTLAAIDEIVHCSAFAIFLHRSQKYRNVLVTFPTNTLT